MSIEVKGIVKSFNERTVLHEVNLHIATGELVALLGPSGCGKTTLLRIIAGLETPDGGQVLFDEADATRSRANERKVGFVFQHYALFRHMTVFENVAFGLRVRPKKFRPDFEAIRKRVMDLLELVQVDFLANYYPSQLSGGQRQRVALARALAVEPKVLLLDEPFGALDAKVRQELRRWLRRLHDDIRITSVFVTHDQEEALEVADRVVVMNDGRIEQQGTADQVYDNPSTPFVYSFLGNVNQFKGRIDGGKAFVAGQQYDLPQEEKRPDGDAVIFVRPHKVDVTPAGAASSGIRAWLEHYSRAGSGMKIELKMDDGSLVQAEMGQDRFHELGMKKGDIVYVNLKEIRVFSQPVT